MFENAEDGSVSSQKRKWPIFETTGVTHVLGGSKVEVESLGVKEARGDFLVDSRKAQFSRSLLEIVIRSFSIRTHVSFMFRG